MKSLVRTLGCSTCGGALALGPSQRLVTCPYCERKKLVLLDRIAPRYFAPPTIDAATARETMLAPLADRRVVRGFRDRVRMTPPQLFFVPFYELTAQRVGRTTLDVSKLNARPKGPFDSGWDKPADLPTYDTKVLIASVTAYRLAVDLPGWGVERLQPGLARTEGDGLQTYDPIQLDRLGTAFEPTLDYDGARDRIRADLARPGADSQLIDERITLLFLPVWRSSFTHQGRVHRVGIDGLSGNLLRAEVPADPRSSVVVLMATALVSALAAAMTVDLLWSVDSGAGRLGAFLAGVATLAVLLPIGMAVMRELTPPDELVLPAEGS